MISVSEAQSLVIEHTVPLAPTMQPLAQCRGLVLARPLLAGIDLPLFNNSAMDGYAVCDVQRTDWELVGEVQAGADASTVALAAGQAVRIFTGAHVPATADAVVMQEHIERTGQYITLTEGAVKHGQHIRKQGEELKAGEVALHNGTLLTPAALGFVATLGQAEACVRPRPRVQLVTTGNELVPTGNALGGGQIFESNSAALRAAVEQSGGGVFSHSYAPDTLEATKAQLADALDQCEVLLVSGGISVGDYDFVGQALRELGVEEVFYKVRQRPGKPLFFGKRNNTLVFALPGNPASALVCYYQYVYPAMRKLMGHQRLRLPTAELPLQHDFRKKAGRAWFVRAMAGPKGVRSLEGQGSHMMSSFAQANALMQLDAEVENVAAGTAVTVHLLPQ